MAQLPSCLIGGSQWRHQLYGTGTPVTCHSSTLWCQFYYPPASIDESIDVKRFLRFLFLTKRVLTFFLNFCNAIKTVDNGNVSVSKLCTWNVGRTLVLSLEWCDRTPQFSGLFPVRRFIGLHHCIHITRTYDWLRLTFKILFTNLTAFALYNHACYNTEILIKLLAFFIQRLQTFFS